MFGVQEIADLAAYDIFVKVGAKFANVLSANFSNELMDGRKKIGGEIFEWEDVFEASLLIDKE